MFSSADSNILGQEVQDASNNPNEDSVQVLVNITQEKIRTTITQTNPTSTNLIKGLVSQKNNRFSQEGFDLDLTYITERIIAMGLPSASFDKIFRNGIEDVQHFFEVRHPYMHKVYNLCEEKTYPGDTFYQQGFFPFKDHEPPPLNIIMPFCMDAFNWLSKDEDNVIAVHCKAGKGRSGVLISCLLLYCGFLSTAEECMRFYGIMRTENGKGVTVPSQIRYVYYFENMVKNNLPYPLIPPTLTITKFKMGTLPNFSVIGYSCRPYFIIENDGKTYRFKDYNKKETYYDNISFVEFPVNMFQVTGDVKVAFWNKNTIGKTIMFKFWFNTYFIPSDGILIIPKNMLDKACKDTGNKHFKDNFQIEVYFIF